MTAMHLPDPTMFGSRGRPGVSLESILDPPTLEIEQQCIRLPPIVHMQDPTTRNCTVGPPMSRTQSVSSASSYGIHSIYQQTPCASPTLSYQQTPCVSPTLSSHSLEPSYDGPRSMNRLGMYNSHLSQKPHFVPAPSAVAASRAASRATRKKRTDRHKFVPRNGTVAPVKAEVEGNRRYLQALGYSRGQATMLQNNPSLPETAAPRQFREQGGWHELKSNNRSEDIRQHEGIEPYSYGKEDIMMSMLLTLEQDNTIIHDVMREIKALAEPKQSGVSAEEQVMFLRLKINDLEARVNDSCGRRGGRDWRSPAHLSEERNSS